MREPKRRATPYVGRRTAMTNGYHPKKDGGPRDAKAKSGGRKAAKTGETAKSANKTKTTEAGSAKPPAK